jgi:hypothetical protein
MSPFKALGMFVLGYAAYGVATGQVYGRYRAWGRTFRRDGEPWLYWSTICVYTLLGLALVFAFGRIG